MKKVILIVVAPALIFLLAGCGEEKKPNRFITTTPDYRSSEYLYTESVTHKGVNYVCISNGGRGGGIWCERSE